MDNFLKVENVISGYSNGFLLKNINFSINKSSFVGIIGPNGAGKSTLLKTVAGILKPLKGNIYLANNDIFKIDAKLKSRKIAYVSQFIENKNYKVFDFLLTGRFPYFKKYQIFETIEDVKKVKYYMQLFNISRYENKYLYELSGGEQQIVSICAALIQEPELLLLDEPTAHLDLKYQINILDLLQDLNEKKNLTILSVFHDLNLAAEYCNYLILLKNGEIFSQGIPEKVIDYKVLEQVYEIVIVTNKNPLTGKPFVLPASKKSFSSFSVKN